jgi:hypothetical protein
MLLDAGILGWAISVQRLAELPLADFHFQQYFGFSSGEAFS